MPIPQGSLLVRCVMTNSSGLPEDEFVNDFVFKTQGAVVDDNADHVAACDAADQFYNFVTTTGGAVGNYIGTAVNRAATHRQDVYRIGAGPLGSPVFSRDWLGPVAASIPNNIPTEVAAVLSFHADLTGVLEESGATRPKARRRGRLYVGPLTVGAVDITADRPFLKPAFLQTMREAANEMFDVAAGDQLDWSVWSRADQNVRTVVAGWTDNAPDTQRRRGQASTARVVFTTTP